MTVARPKRPPGATLLRRWIDARRASPPPGTRFSVSAMAELIGVARQNLNQWRSGRSRPNSEHAAKLAELTNDDVPAASWKETA